MSKELVPRESQAIEKPKSLLEVIAQAVSDPRMDVEKMRALFELQRDIQREQAKVAFMAAMARLQGKLPQIVKMGQAKNSKHAKLEDIDTVIRPLLAEEGFSLSFDEEAHTEKTSTFVMILAHGQGHSEAKRLTVPVDSAASNREGRAIRPAIQDAGSTVSYARRYLLKMQLNIVERDEDTDGEPRGVITEDQALNIRALIQEVQANEARFLELIAFVDKIENIDARDYRRVINALETRRRMPPKANAHEQANTPQQGSTAQK